MGLAKVISKHGKQPLPMALSCSLVIFAHAFWKYKAVLRSRDIPKSEMNEIIAHINTYVDEIIRACSSNSRGMFDLPGN